MNSISATYNGAPITILNITGDGKDANIVYVDSSNNLKVGSNPIENRSYTVSPNVTITSGTTSSGGTYTLPIATSSTIGGVMQGSGTIISSAGAVDVRGNLASNADVPYTAFDFSTTPDGPFPYSDKFGNHIHIEYAVANATGISAIISGGGAILTRPTSGSGAAYIGLQSDGTVQEIGFKSIGGPTIAITEHLDDSGVFNGWNWPAHIQFGANTINFGMYVAGVSSPLASVGFSPALSTTVPTIGLIKFQNNTCLVYLNGKLVCSVTDTRFTSMVRRYAIFEPTVSNTNPSTKIIAGYVKTSKITEMTVCDSVPVNPFTTFLDTSATSYTLTSAFQQIRGFQAVSNISSAIVIVRLRLNQSATGPIQLDLRGTTPNSVVTSNIVTISNSIKDDVICVPVQVNGLGGGFLSVYARGAYGSIPIQTSADASMLTIIPTAYWTNP